MLYPNFGKAQLIPKFALISALRKLGQDINDARRRRRITLKLMAERDGLSRSRSTIGKIEKGDPTTSMGSYGSVLFVLGIEKRLVAAIKKLLFGFLEDQKIYVLKSYGFMSKVIKKVLPLNMIKNG